MKPTARAFGGFVMAALTVAALWASTLVMPVAATLQAQVADTHAVI